MCKATQPSSRLKDAPQVPINAGAMALRLTDAATSLRPAPAAAAPEPAAAPSIAAELVARARTALAGRDAAAYLALFAEAAAAEDVHRRYEARKRLVEAGLSAEGDRLTVATAFAATARAAVTVLEEEPREPELLAYAGVAFYEVGELDAAEALFKAARRLDSDAPNLEANLDEIARRRREGLTRVDLPKPLTLAVRELAPRAKKVAAHARPAEGQRISLCMIVKDEEAMLGRCLEAVAAHVDELIVVDTGSKDRTVEIAQSFGATVLHHVWTGDFAEARNASLDAATGDWILYLDADEVLVDGDGPRLRALAGRTWREALYLVETNHTGELEDGTAVTHNALRMFRRRPAYRFHGRLHEQFAHRLPGFLPERLEATDVRIDHFGYLGAVRDAKEKSRRNIELVRRQIAEGEDTPFLHFNLGSELIAADQPQAALEEFRVSWARLKEGGPAYVQRQGFAPSLCNRLIKALRVCGHLDEASERAVEVLDLFPGFTDIVFEQALIARERGDLPETERLLRRCLELGDAPSRYSSTRGMGTYIAMLTLADHCRHAGRLAEAEQFAVACLEQHPSFLGVVEPYATVRLAAGADPGAVVAEVKAALGQLSPGASFMLAVPLFEAGAADLAEAELRAVVETRPDSEPARLALAEALLAQGKLAEADAVVAPIPGDAPAAGAAARTRLFALLADGRAQDAMPVLACAFALPTAERAAFGAWRAALAGEEPPATLPADAARPIATMLEALARIEAFEAFELLAGRLETVAVSWRDRRELLAGVYLRRGYLESAADEWMLVCQEQGPDVPALLGLAQVAWAHGMDEDATVFAHEVLALSPGHAGASALLEHLAAQAAA